MASSGLETLAAALAAGDQRAYAELYDRLAGRLFRTAMTMLGHREDAEDAVQDVFAAMVRSRDKLAHVEDLKAYVFASLRRSAARIGARRGRGRVALAAAAKQVRRSGPADAGDDRLARALGRLPGKQREVIAMKIDAELTFAEIGRALGISPNTVASRFRYALEKLRGELER